ncbi:uncharacterized protein LOC124808643 isoform X1 [Hydra vulgaris]|uniref:uncharacterized protein LOC124808643 isoform X1 n=1 Tax=Hydra vulgaris TaxID=6087 RepID=UPI0002B4D636|nr:gamma-glutamyl peptidase 2-like [Hydra vulgaris]
MSKTVAIIVCDEYHGEDENGKAYIDLFKKDEVEHWEYFKAVSGHLPDFDMIKSYLGFILTGSYCSANDEVKWIWELTEFIKRVVQFQSESQSAPKLFGFCFGHQLICKTLGARVVKNKVGRFIISVTDIEIFSSLQSMEYYSNVFHSEKFMRLVKMHEEEVIDLPSNAILLGSSEQCQNEIVSFGNKILTMQGHVDILEEQLREIYLPIFRKDGKINEIDEAILLDNIAGKPYDSTKIVEFVRQFFYL